MTQKEMEKKLRRCALSCRKIPGDAKEANIQKLLQLTPIPRTRGTLWDFVLEQVGYLGRYCLLWQLLWLALFCWLMEQNILPLGKKSGSEIFVLLSLLPPVLVLLTVGEITKVYQRSMLEIEQVTKYSLEKVVVIRMLILCIFHSLILFFAILYLRGRSGSHLEKLFIYGFTPMILMTGILLWLMKEFQGEQLKAWALSLYGVILAFALLENTRHFDLYNPSYFNLWCLLFWAGITFLICQFTALRKKLSNLEHLLAPQFPDG